jgi:hypothetical protein
MAQHAIANVRCTLATPTSYGQLRCDSSGIPVCPIPSSSGSSSGSSFVSSLEEISSEEAIGSPSSSIISEEVSSEFSSEIEISSEEASSPTFEISSLEAPSFEEESSSEEVSSEKVSGGPGPQPPAPSESSTEGISSEGISSEGSLLPCVSSNECDLVDCDDCCAVQIRDIRFDVESCPSSLEDRDIILWFYSPQELAALCKGHGEYCDFVALTETACDEVSGVAILYFDVCCGCSKSSS